MPRATRRSRKRSRAADVGFVLAAVAVLWPMAANAGAWTLGAGRLSLKESAAFWQTDRKFASTLDTELVFPGRGPVSAGDTIPFDPVTGGRLRTLGFTTSATLGVLSWLDVGLNLPLLWTDFDTAPVDTVDSRFGLGDLILSAQAQALRRPRIALAGRIEWKLPTGRFDPSIYSAPLTEGQMDLAILSSVGVSLYPYGYANVEAGWRFRFENPENHRDPGDEFLFLVEGGLDLPRGLLLKLAFDGLVGTTGSISRFDVVTELPSRRLFSLWTTLLWRATEHLMLELSGRYLLAGEDFPTGIQVMAGVTYQLELWGRRRR